MTSHKLGDLAEIISGFTFRSAIEAVSWGNYRVVQSKDITGNLEISGNDLAKIDIKKNNPSAVIGDNDVVLASRGKYKAAIINSSEPVIASSSVFIIRPFKKSIKSSFLALYLNSPSGQSQLEKLSSGNYIKSVPKFNLIKLEIPIPEIDVQEKIIDLYSNINNQRKLLNRKIKIISNISSVSLINILNTK